MLDEFLGILNSFRSAIICTKLSSLISLILFEVMCFVMLKASYSRFGGQIDIAAEACKI